MKVKYSNLLNKLVVIHWKDIVSFGLGWWTIEEKKSEVPADMLSSGWVIEVTKDYIKIAGCISNDFGFSHGTVIPIGIIKKITKIDFKVG